MLLALANVSEQFRQVCELSADFRTLPKFIRKPYKNIKTLQKLFRTVSEVSEDLRKFSANFQKLLRLLKNGFEFTFVY